MTGIALCGQGNIGAVHLRNLLSLRGARVQGVYEPRPGAETPGGINRYESYGALLADPAVQAVLIATPTDTHRELTIQALRCGKHVFLEKPIAGTIEDAEAIAAATHDSALVVQIGFCERFNPQYLESKRAVESGALGPLRAIYSSRIAPFSLGNPAWELGIFDTAIHNIDLILWLMGAAPTEVGVSAVQLYPESAIPHSAVTTLRFAGGAIATDHITWLRDDPHPLHQCARSRMLILGERGSFEIDLSSRPSALLTAAGYSAIDTVILGSPEYYGCLKLQLEYFLRSIEDGAPILAPAEDALLAERVILAARESLRQGRVTPL